MDLRLFGKSNKVYKVTNEKQQEIMKEVQKLAKIANNRLADLEKSNLTMASAYANWEKSGGVAFGNVRGNSYQSYQSEYWRIKRFLDSATSTVSGAKDVLRKMASNTNYSASTYEDFKKFFSVADRVSDYYKMIGDTARALDYQRIWESINVAVQHGKNINDDMGLDDIMELLEVATDIEKEKRVIASTPNNVNVASGKTGIVGKIGRMLKSGLNALRNLFSVK